MRNNNCPLGSSCKSRHNNRIAPRTLRGGKIWTGTCASHPKSTPTQRCQHGTEQPEGNPISIRSEAAREAEATHRVLHGGPPPLHGGEAEPDAAVLSIGGELVRLGRAEVHPHLLLPPGPGSSNPAPQQNHTRPSSACAQAQRPFPRRRREIDPRTPSEPNQTARIAAVRGETTRRGSDSEGMG